MINSTGLNLLRDLYINLFVWTKPLKVWFLKRTMLIIIIAKRELHSIFLVLLYAHTHTH